MIPRLVTRRSLVLEVVDRWRESYRHYIFGPHQADPHGKDKREAYERLQALHLGTCDPAEVDAIIGNGSWTRVSCDQCRKEVEEAVIVGQEPDYESCTATLCRRCVAAAVICMGAAS